MLTVAVNSLPQVLPQLIEASTLKPEIVEGT